MHTSEIISLALSALAVFITFINLRKFILFSKIGVYSTLQQLVLKKAQDCNNFWLSIDNEFHYLPQSYETEYFNTFSEISISLQLIDETLNEISSKDFKKKRIHFLKLFWIQLNTSLREYILTATFEGQNKSYSQLVLQIRKAFSPFFKVHPMSF